MATRRNWGRGRGTEGGEGAGRGEGTEGDWRRAWARMVQGEKQLRTKSKNGSHVGRVHHFVWKSKKEVILKRVKGATNPRKTRMDHNETC